MPNIKSKIKRVKTNNKANMENKSYKSSVKTAIKKAKLALITGDKKVESFINKAIEAVDKAVSKGIFKPNKGKRIRKSLMIKLDKFKEYHKKEKELLAKNKELNVALKTKSPEKEIVKKPMTLKSPVKKTTTAAKKTETAKKPAAKKTSVKKTPVKK